VAHGTAGVRRGDVIVFWRDGRLIAHRVLRVCRGDATPRYVGPAFITKGDGVSHLDPPLSVDEVVGRVLAVERGDRVMSLDTAAWRVAGWLMAVSTLTWGEMYHWGRRLKRGLLGSRPSRLGAVLKRSIPLASQALRSLGLKFLQAAVCRWRKR
jgi:hypothetical protein